ncbi:CD226 antigen isoform X3 [Engraulis encrasicolus]|uniref:CD226 antigen isoform X3 n=1 Tax=Engraulis encrasicolus TaxID=184585 RepID=UPI002FCF26C0
MEAVQKDNWYSLALLTFLIFLKASLQDRGETVTLADGMVLDCMCPWNGNLSMVSWTKVPDKTALAIFHPSYGTTFGDGYDERLMFLRKSTMDGSISFGNVTEQDAGLYRCSMQTFPLGTWTRDVRVIKESHSPYVELDFSEGENLTIVCPHHNYSVMHALIKKDENETVGRCTMQAGALVAEDLHEGIQMNCADPILGVTFDLNNVAESDQGLYQCLLTTEDGVEITNYLLTVRHEDPDPAEATDITEAPHSDTEDSEPPSSGKYNSSSSSSSIIQHPHHHPSPSSSSSGAAVSSACLGGNGKQIHYLLQMTGRLKRRHKL